MRVTRRAGRAVTAGVAAGLLGAVLAAAGPASAVDRPSSSPAELASTREVVTGSGPLSVAVVVPITVPTGAQGTGLLDSDTIATDTGPTGVLTRQLAAVTGSAAVLAIDPMILVSIRVLGTAMPSSARAWLAQLEALPNEKMPLAYADADPGVLAHTSGGVDLLSNLDFQFALNTDDFGPAATPTPTPTSTSTPTPTPTPTGDDTDPTPTPTATGQPVKTPLPTNAQLLSAPGAYVAADIAWPAAGTVTQSDLARLAGAGYRRVLLGSDNVSAASSARVQLDGIEGLVSDDGLSAIARQAVGASTDATLQDALQRLDAALGGMQAVSPGRSVIATLDRGWSVSATHVRELLQNLEAQTSAQSVGLSAVLDGPIADAKVVDGGIPDDGAGLLDKVVQTVPAEASFATVAGDQAARIASPRRLELLSTMSVAWVETDTGWSARLRSYIASSARLLDSVRIVQGSGVLVTASSTSIPVTVSNALAVPITVDVTVDPGSFALRIENQRIPLKVEAGATARLFVPAQALSTQKVSATVSLRSATDPEVLVGGTDAISVDMRPSYEGIGTGIVVILLVIVFGGGIVRQVLRRRRARNQAARAVDAEPAANTEDRG